MLPAVRKSGIALLPPIFLLLLLSPAEQSTLAVNAVQFTLWMPLTVTNSGMPLILVLFRLLLLLTG